MSDREEFMTAAWAGYLDFAYRHEGMRAQFTAETGRVLSAPSPPIDAMIDHATGKDEEDAMAFIIWATRSYWGWEESAASFREDAEAWERRQGEKAASCR